MADLQGTILAPNHLMEELWDAVDMDVGARDVPLAVPLGLGDGVMEFLGLGPVPAHPLGPGAYLPPNHLMEELWDAVDVEVVEADLPPLVAPDPIVLLQLLQDDTPHDTAALPHEPVAQAPRQQARRPPLAGAGQPGQPDLPEASSLPPGDSNASSMTLLGPGTGGMPFHGDGALVAPSQPLPGPDTDLPSAHVAGTLSGSSSSSGDGLVR
jgi:hypothetical protein